MPIGTSKDALRPTPRVVRYARRIVGRIRRSDRRARCWGSVPIQWILCATAAEDASFHRRVEALPHARGNTARISQPIGRSHTRSEHRLDHRAPLEGSLHTLPLRELAVVERNPSGMLLRSSWSGSHRLRYRRILCSKGVSHFDVKKCRAQVGKPTNEVVTYFADASQSVWVVVDKRVRAPSPRLANVD
jgi:hypothetical protein